MTVPSTPTPAAAPAPATGSATAAASAAAPASAPAAGSQPVVTTDQRLPAATILGYPCAGPGRELERALESYWQGALDEAGLRQQAARLRQATRAHLRDLGLHGAGVPADFTYGDQLLQVTCAFGALPRRFAGLRGTAAAGHPGTSLLGLLTAARGQGEQAALQVTTWPDAGGRYSVPELSPETLIDYVPGFGAVDPTDGPVAQVLEAAAGGEEPPRPVVVGPVTYLLLAQAADGAAAGFRPLDRLDGLLHAYGHLLADLWAAGASWAQLDEPALVDGAWDLPRTQVLDVAHRAYTWLAAITERPQLLVAAGPGPLGEALPVLARTEVEALALDLVAGPPPQPEDLARLGGRTLVAGVVSGRSASRSDLAAALGTLQALRAQLPGEARLVVATASSLQHPPHERSGDAGAAQDLRSWLAAADQKVQEVQALATALEQDRGLI
ncbi:hypothetical protein [Actinomyces weissii]|uniref:Cobalamin-independent methionine synthase MetE N-terminal domain-containing protein n=1 Tax=Actinomyces weissii TaxID=675090 RepID=A0A7T7S3D1_9ACTO|nr:hypothetical protein [Actinomyces weissii]QQM68487.1 hypothetical protein JG540_01110 [Actinomyces weissii]